MSNSAKSKIRRLNLSPNQTMGCYFSSSQHILVFLKSISRMFFGPRVDLQYRHTSRLGSRARNLDHKTTRWLWFRSTMSVSSLFYGRTWGVWFHSPGVRLYVSDRHLNTTVGGMVCLFSRLDLRFDHLLHMPLPSRVCFTFLSTGTVMPRTTTLTLLSCSQHNLSIMYIRPYPHNDGVVVEP